MLQLRLKAICARYFSFNIFVGGRQCTNLTMSLSEPASPISDGTAVCVLPEGAGRAVPIELELYVSESLCIRVSPIQNSESSIFSINLDSCTCLQGGLKFR